MVENDNDLRGRELGDGEFVLGERIGGGAFGTVFRAKQPLLEREVVVKLLRRDLRRDRAALKRFTREARIAAKFDHHYAAKIHQFGIAQPDGLFWIAMELVDGITLDRLLRTRGPLSVGEFVPFFRKVAQVVQAAHEKGIVHRDLKPENIMVIERDGQLIPKLLDFGVAKLLDGAEPAVMSRDREVEELPPSDVPTVNPDDPDDTAPMLRRRPRRPLPARRLTSTSAAIGSPAYMAPEQWMSALSVGTPADLYALGVVAYEALTCRLPFTASGADLVTLHCHAAVPPLGDGFPVSLDSVLQRALAKRPEDRYGSVGQFSDALCGEIEASARAEMSEQIRTAAQQWAERGRPHGVLWRDEMLADLEQWLENSGPQLAQVEREFIDASRLGEAAARAELLRHRRRYAGLRRWLAGLAVAAACGAVLAVGLHLHQHAESERQRADLAELKRRAAEREVTLRTQAAELEAGRAASLHDEAHEARLHLTEAYRLGDRSSGLMFMLARAFQPRLAERARFPATSGRMWSAVFSPDGRQVVTTDEGGARVWDVATNRLLSTLRSGAIVYNAAFTRDGRRVVTAGDDGVVAISDATSGSMLHEFRSDKLHYGIVSVSPDGRRVAGIDITGGTAHVWDAATGVVLAEIHNAAAGFPAIAFSADGRWLAASGGESVKVFDATSWSLVLSIDSPRIHSLAFDPTGPRLAVSTADGDAAIWAIPTGERFRHLREIGDPIDEVAFSPNGKFVVTAGRDGTEHVWSVDTGRLLSQANHIRGKIHAIEFDPTSQLVVAAGANGMVVITDAAQGIPVALLDGATDAVRSVHFDANSGRVVGASWDGTARIWDSTPTYRRWRSDPIANSCGVGMSLEPDARFVAVLCRDHNTRIWDTAKDVMLAELPSSTRVPGDVAAAFPAVSAAGDRAAIPRGNAVEVYELPGGRLLRSVAHGSQVSAVAFAPVDNEMISGDIGGSVLITRGDREPLALPVAHGAVDAVALLPDGRAVVADARPRVRIYDRGGAVLADMPSPLRAMLLRAAGGRLVGLASYTQGVAPALWDLDTYQFVGRLDGHRGQVRSARFVGDREVLTAGADGTARRWDSATGALLQTYRAGAVTLLDVAQSPDQSFIIAGTADGRIQFWDVVTTRPLWALRAHNTQVIGVHFEASSIVSRGFAGDVSRWTLSSSQDVIAACASAQTGNRADDVPCGIVPR